MKKEKGTIYVRVMGENGVYLLTVKEFCRAIDRENEGVVGTIIEENDYQVK